MMHCFITKKLLNIFSCSFTSSSLQFSFQIWCEYIFILLHCNICIRTLYVYIFCYKLSFTIYKGLFLSLRLTFNSSQFYNLILSLLVHLHSQLTTATFIYIWGYCRKIFKTNKTLWDLIAKEN